MVIEPAQTVWASSIVSLLKTTNTYFGVDYCELNADTIRDSYPISHNVEYIVWQGDTLIFQTLGENKGSWQVYNFEVKGGRIPFTSDHDLFLVTCMPFVFQNAPETCQPAMDVLLTKSKWNFCSFQLRRYRHVFAYVRQSNRSRSTIIASIRRNWLTPDQKECKSFQNGTSHLIHIIIVEFFKDSTRSIDVMQGPKHPTTVTEL